MYYLAKDLFENKFLFYIVGIKNFPNRLREQFKGEIK